MISELNKLNKIRKIRERFIYISTLFFSLLLINVPNLLLLPSANQAAKLYAHELLRAKHLVIVLSAATTDVLPTSANLAAILSAATIVQLVGAHEASQ